MSRIFKTIIVGAGPAGLIAGRYLKDAIILDKRKEIGRPVQYVGVSREALKVQRIKPNSKWARTKIYKVERVMPNGKVIGCMHKNFIGYVVEKKGFEKYLSQRVKCKIKLNTEVKTILKLKDGHWQIKTKKGEILKCQYIIGADGFNSIIRKKIFPENNSKLDFVSGLEYSVKFKKKFNQKIVKIYLNNRKYKNGYAWIFATSNYTANIGVGGRGNFEKKLTDFLKRSIKKDYGEYQIIKKTKGTLASKKKKLNLFKFNVLLVGDAAGFADPIFKAGTNQAMISAKIAAQCILANRANLYEEKISSMPFTGSAIFRASKILYSLSNKTLKELGNILEGRSFSNFKNFLSLTTFLRQKYVRKDILKIIFLFSIWKKNQKWLW